MVLSLYKNATGESSRRTSKCGINHFRCFALQYIGTELHPISLKSISLKGLLLSFFAASLFLNPKNLQYATIRNYVGHIRAKWVQAGVPLCLMTRNTRSCSERDINLTTYKTRHAGSFPPTSSMDTPILLVTTINWPIAFQSRRHFRVFWHA